MTRTFVLTAATAALLALTLSSPAEAQGRRRGRWRADLAPKQGSKAPDFEICRLVKGKANPKKKVKLSSFKGKRPVALVFGSYT